MVLWSAVGGVRKIRNPESGKGTGTSKLKTGDFLKVLLTIVTLVRLFILIRFIDFLIKAFLFDRVKIYL